MNEEEKKAIEDMNRFANGIDMSCVTARQMQIILNLIEKKKNCINILDDELKERDKTINEKEIIIEKLQKENEELKLKERRIIGKYGDVEIHDVINRTLSNDYIPVQRVKDKIEKEIKYHERNILDIENITMLKSKTAKEEAEIEFNKYAIVVLKKILQELIKEREEEHNGK